MQRRASSRCGRRSPRSGRRRCSACRCRSVRPPVRPPAAAGRGRFRRGRTSCRRPCRSGRCACRSSPGRHRAPARARAPARNRRTRGARRDRCHGRCRPRASAGGCASACGSRGPARSARRRRARRRAGCPMRRRRPACNRARPKARARCRAPVPTAGCVCRRGAPSSPWFRTGRARASRAGAISSSSRSMPEMPQRWNLRARQRLKRNASAAGSDSRRVRPCAQV